MSELLPFVITGLSTGSLYGLAGMGLVLTYRTSGIFNFAHGAIAAAAAFVFYELHYSHGVPWPMAAILTVIVFGMLAGVALERVTRGIAGASPAIMVVATVGISLAIQGFLAIQFGAVSRIFPEFLPTSGVNIGGVSVSWSQSLSFLISASAGTGLYLYLRTARIGVAMRASVDNPTLLALSGERPTRIRSVAWIIGCSFAALSGVLLAPTLGLDATLLTFLVVQAFGACALGRFSSLPLTFVGGLAIGVAASISTRYLTDPPLNGVASVMPVIVLLGLLLITPARKLPLPRFARTGGGSGATSLSARSRTTIAAIGASVLILLPFLVGTKLPVFINAMSYAVLFASLGMLVWTSGQISLCHASFAALGATSVSHLSDQGLPWLLAVLLAGLLTIPVGAIVAIPAIRLSGLYLALMTLGFGIVMQNVVFATSFMFGRRLVVQAPRPAAGFIDGTNDRWLYFVYLGITLACFASIGGLLRSRMGRLLRGLAESPTMLSTHGLNVASLRLLVFCASAFFAGIAGAMIVTQFSAASGIGFGPIQSLLLLAVLTISGSRPLAGAAIAATLFSVIPGYASTFDTDRQTFAFGVVTVLAAIVQSKRSEITEWMQRRTAEVKPYRPRDRPAEPPDLDRPEPHSGLTRFPAAVR